MVFSISQQLEDVINDGRFGAALPKSKPSEQRTVQEKSATEVPKMMDELRRRLCDLLIIHCGHSIDVGELTLLRGSTRSSNAVLEYGNLRSGNALRKALS